MKISLTTLPLGGWEGAKYCNQGMSECLCPLAYLKNHMFKCHEIFLYMSPVAVAWIFSDDSAVCYALQLRRCLRCLPLTDIPRP